MSKPLAEELTEFQTTLDLYRKQYVEDGTITADELTHLDVLEGKIKQLRSAAGSSNAGNGNGQLSGVGAGGPGTVTPLEASPGQRDSSNGSPGDGVQDVISSMSGQVSADSSKRDEPQGSVRPILVAMDPPPGVTLPTIDGKVELVSENEPTKRVQRGEVLKRPDYVDNFTKATLKVPIAWDMKDANKLTLNLFYSSGSPVALHWPLLLFQWEQPSYSYGRQLGKIVPYDPKGNPLFDKNNTPSLILAALFFKDELDKLAVKYEQIADITYTFSGSVSGGSGMRRRQFQSRPLWIEKRRRRRRQRWRWSRFPGGKKGRFRHSR